MGSENDLLEELRALRDRLRAENTVRGKAPTVCSDEALRQMAAHPPMKESDLLALDGFGEKSVEKYGDFFLRATRRYAVSAAGGQGIDAETARALRELQKRLVNLSRTNRMLFLPRTSASVSMDIGPFFGPQGLELATAKRGKLVIPKSEYALFRRANSILREVNRDLRERGAYDLYIGYPFVEGMLQGDDGFPVRAPLALFPVIMEKHGDEITVEYDDSRDAVFNTTLVLASMKAAKVRGDLDDAVIDDGDALAKQMAAFYSSCGIPADIPEGIEPFSEYRKGSFPEHAPGSFEVCPNLVLGKFPSYSSLIERDIDMLINGREVNENLRDLLKGIYSGDFRSEFPLPLTAADLAAKGIVPREASLFPVNELDAAQEAALAALSEEDGLVVQGPPGTGKSQVITAMIASAAASGKTVLMVSEKKTALDVVRSRLGDLSKYCMQVDDTADKEGFFRQLRGILSTSPAGSRPDIAGSAESIDRMMSGLGGISDRVFSPGSFGISPADLYDVCAETDPAYVEKYGEVAKPLLSLSVEDMDRMVSRFSEGRLLRSLKAYSAAVARMPWAEYLRPDLTERELGAMVTDLGEIYQENASVSKKGFIGRFFAGGRLSKHASAMAAKYLVDYSKSDVEDLISDCEGAAEFLEEYDMFQAHAEDFRSLNAAERSWWRGMGHVSRRLGVEHPESALVLRNLIMCAHLADFDADYDSLESESRGYAGIVGDISSSMESRREACRKYADSVLSSYLSEIRDSKRYADISRISEQKRKWSIAKFAGRYGYELFRGIRIWLMTPEAVSETIPLEMGTFDLLVFDEASQMFAERGVPSIYRAGKTVVAGDHKQLRPSALGRGRLTYDDDEDAPEEGSLLDLARSRYDSVLLNYHYRSERSALIAFSDRAFYGGRLFVSPDTVSGDEPPIRVIRSEGVWNDRVNEEEARTTVRVLREVLENRRNNETVGVIAFNVHQMDLVSDLLEEECSADPAFGKLVAKEEARTDRGEDTGLFVKNVESVQGDERDIIIFSIGYSKGPDGKFGRRFGWLNMAGGENRLNVAVTRAKKQMVVVKSFGASDLDVDNTANAGPKLLKSYLEYAEAVSANDLPGAESVLDSISSPHGESPKTSAEFMDRLCAELVSRGYEAERDVGIGSCILDVAVRKGGRYVIGIEDDRRIYAAGGTVRERDYHRERFLANRGWRTVRTWTPAVQRNPDGEMERILSEVEKACGNLSG